jgi:predicted site-specific integrase-resolvase
VASRDRLARFGFELIEWLCKEFGTELLVLDTEDTTPETELGKDLMSIVQVYCCRWNGKRRYTKKENQSIETED